MPNTPTPINWKTFLAGVACGLLIASVGFCVFYPGSPSQSAGSVENSDFTPGGTLARVAGETPPTGIRLRPASFSCDAETAKLALEIKRAGWTYIMPQPNSSHAKWGNDDIRSRWWVGYWTNEANQTASLAQPQRAPNGKLVGDGKGGHNWRRGGSPPTPTKIEWLCSVSGGIPPQ